MSYTAVFAICLFVLVNTTSAFVAPDDQESSKSDQHR